MRGTPCSCEINMAIPESVSVHKNIIGYHYSLPLKYKLKYIDKKSSLRVYIRNMHQSFVSTRKRSNSSCESTIDRCS